MSDTALPEILGPVRAGDGHPAQLFRVQVISSTSVSLACSSLPAVIAKIYDPLYFDHEDGVDPFRCVDRAYTHEFAIYARLADLQGNSIPRFYGSFSLSLPGRDDDDDDDNTDNGNIREVRLILTEWIPGTTMQDLDPSRFSQVERQRIMKAMVDAETAIYNHDIVHRDFHPRNIMVPPAVPGSEEARETTSPALAHQEANQVRPIVIVDFGKASTSRSPFPEWEDRFLPGVPISPLLRWVRPWKSRCVDWNWREWIRELYEGDRSSITPYMWERWGSRKRPAKGDDDKVAKNNKKAV